MDFDDIMCEVKWAINHLCRMPRNFILACKSRKHNKEIAEAIVKFYTTQSRRDYMKWEQEQWKAGNRTFKVELMTDVWIEKSQDFMSTIVWVWQDYDYYCKVLPADIDMRLDDWARRWYKRQWARNIRKMLDAQQWICM